MGKTIGKKTTFAGGAVRDSVDGHVELWSRELDWLDPVKEAIFVRIGIISRHAAQTRMDALADGGMRRWQFKILLALRRRGAPYTARPSELADALGLTRGALSARLKPLEEDGLITRSAEAADRRRVHVALTSAGNAALERHAAREEDIEQKLLAGLAGPERRTLADLLRTLVMAIEGERAGPERP
jgi:DNA-binding MarR family transcriptional regulator